MVVDDLVRLGSPFDGGYVIPRRVVESATVLVGFGIDIDWSFEEDFLAQNSSVRLVAVDGTTGTAQILWRSMRALYWGAYELRSDRSALGRRLQEAISLVLRGLKFRAFFRSSNRWFVKKLASSVAAEGFVTWNELVSKMAIESRDKLCIKMDIEGAEYDVLPTILASAASIVGIVIEYHNLDTQFKDFERIHALLDEDFALVHAHCNNFTQWISTLGCTAAIEATYLNRELLDSVTRVDRGRYYQPELDSPCNPTRDERYLSF